jgi:two-component system, sensor histidine kinase and response regulator
VQKNYSTWGVTWLELADQKGVGINSDLCASLHKLRGSAGMLGAAELAAAAERAESSILDGSVLPLEAVQQVAKVLDELLARVERHTERRESGGPWMDAPGVLTSSGRKKLHTLAEMLARCDMDAIDLGLALRQELVSLLGQDGAEELLQKMDELDFNAAYSRLINQLQQSDVAV